MPELTTEMTARIKRNLQVVEQQLAALRAIHRTARVAGLSPKACQRLDAWLESEAKPLQQDRESLRAMTRGIRTGQIHLVKVNSTDQAVGG